MSDVKYRIDNKNKYDFGIVFPDGIRSQNVKAGSFALLTEDEIYYLHSISRAFTGKHLTVKEPHILENLGLVDESSKSLTDEEILNILKGNPMSMKKRLSEITEENQKYRVYVLAKDLDLPKSKLQFIEEFTGKTLMGEE